MPVRTGVRVAEGAGLENRYTRKGIEGSNPSLSVIFNELQQDYQVGYFGRVRFGLELGRIRRLSEFLSTPFRTCSNGFLKRPIRRSRC